MILDRQNTVSQAQAITATVVSTDTIDLGVARDLGTGYDIKFVFTIDQVFNNLTSLEFQVITATTPDLVTGQTVVSTTGPVLLAQLTAGRRPIVMAVNRSIILAQPIGQRYLGCRYVVAGTAPTTGQVTAALVIDAQDIGKHYPSGYSLI